MHSKALLLIVVLLLTALAPLNSAPSLESPLLNLNSQPQLPLQKRWEKRKDKKEASEHKFTPVLPAIALSLGILAVGTFIFAGLPGIIIGALAVIVGSVVLTRRNGYTRKDRIMARIGVLLGSLFLFAGILIIIALLEPTGVNLEGLEPLLEHVLE
ncbi:MAG: hypothetical protein AB8H47_30500 [Bacteroidia bacterium]